MKQQILDLIRANPNIRTVEISDKLDIDLERVRPLIADEIRALVIVEEPIIAPNGREVLSFRYRDAQPKAEVQTPAPESLPARVVRALPPAVRKVVVPAASPEPAPARDVAPAATAAAPVPAQPEKPQEIDVPVTRKESVPLQRVVRADGPSRTELGMQCLRESSGPVSSAVLSVAMGLPKHHYPISYLRGAIKRNEIARVGSDWVLVRPQEKAPAAVDLPEPVVTVRELVPTQPSFPRADPAELAAFDPATKQCTMNCGPHADDPRDAAERKLLCGDCIPVAEKVPELAPAEAAPTAAAPVVAEPEAGIDSLDFSRPGVYENGRLRSSPEKAAAAIADKAAADKFVAGLLSDNSLLVTVDGQQRVIPADHARQLWEFMGKMAYIAWPDAWASLT
jgi:hypothetical protein